MPNTYVALRTETIATATPSVTFSLSGISGYTDLVLVANFTVATASANLVMTFNGDTTSGLYSKTQMEGTGTTAISGRTANANNIGLDSNIGDDATSPSIHIINLMNYANTSVFKTVLHRQSGFWSANPGVGARVGLWRNTNAITSITLSNGATNFAVGSTFSLYGIANADQGAAKATGGIITEDSQYWYHTFGASGAFIPKQSLTCDVLVVAGGGGAGYYYGGGGGAGGVQYAASQSLTATTYNVTIGSGGPSRSGSSAGPGTVGVDSSFSSLVIAKGGGFGNGAVSGAANGGNGGSGGGAGGPSSGTGGTTVAGTGGTFYGFAGGSGLGGNSGGGAGQAGASLAKGGNGTAAFSSWGLATGTGQNVSGTVYYAGGGEANGTYGGGGFGGGGAWLTSGAVNTGGGAGADQNGGAGGSGVVIVRYAK